MSESVLDKLNAHMKLYELVLVVGAFSEFAVVVEGLYSTRELAEEKMAELGFTRENDFTGRMMIEDEADNALLVNRIERGEWANVFESYEAVNLTFQDVEAQIVELEVEDGFGRFMKLAY